MMGPPSVVAPRVVPLTSLQAPPFHALTVTGAGPSDAELRAACDKAIAALEGYAAKANYRGADNGTFQRTLDRLASPFVWTFAAVSGALTAWLGGDPNHALWGLAGGGALANGVRAALPTARHRLMADRSLAPSAARGFVSTVPLEQMLLGHAAKTALADMKKRHVVGVAAEAELTRAAARTSADHPLSATAARLAALITLLPSKLEHISAVDDDRALEILEAFTRLEGREQDVGRALIREMLLETPSAPPMSSGVWQSLYELTRPREVEPAPNGLEGVRSLKEPAMYARALASLKESDRIVWWRSYESKRTRDKVDSGPMGFAMTAGVASVPAVGIAAGLAAGPIVGLAAVAYAVRACVGLFHVLDDRAQGQLARGELVTAFDRALAHLETGTAFGRALAAELARRTIAALDTNDLRGAALRDKLYALAETPHVSNEDREAARQVVTVLALLVPGRELDDAHAAELTRELEKLSPHDREALAPLVTERFLSFRKRPKQLSYESLAKLQALLMPSTELLTHG